MIKSKKVLILFFTLIFLLQAGVASADDWFDTEPGYFTVYDENNKELFMMASEIRKDDEYISGDNWKYRIVEVDKAKKTAKAQFIEKIALPEITKEDLVVAVETMSQPANKTIGLYNTHSDESYEPSDGVSSIKAKGGIFDVTAALGKELEKRGAKAIVNKTPHDPHDAGAYRRSRKTAVTLLREAKPTALFDIHRDAVPKEQYIAKIAGTDLSRVRIVIGRSNQNRKANEAMAYRIKAVADKMYPGFIKDIFIGHGNYNQELIPKALLFEFGTYSHSKERAIKSTALMADVVTKTLFGGTAKAAKPAPTVKSGQKTPTPRQIKVTPMNKKSTGSGSGIFWLLAIVVIGAIGFLVMSTGGKEMWSKVSKSGQEFSSFLGRRRKKKD